MGETPTGSRSLKDSAVYWFRAVLALAVAIVLVTITLSVPVAAKLTGVADLRQENAQLRRDIEEQKRRSTSEVEQLKRDLSAEKAARLIGEAEHRREVQEFKGLITDLVKALAPMAEGYGWMKAWIQRSQAAEAAKGR